MTIKMLLEKMKTHLCVGESLGGDEVGSHWEVYKE